MLLQKNVIPQRNEKFVTRFELITKLSLIVRSISTYFIIGIVLSKLFDHYLSHSVLTPKNRKNCSQISSLTMREIETNTL